ncbi:S-layer protein [Secundilactobacillus yichangensis]|uniref:S-layer protein n=1 Tax=Secundilactobacillus yichangensis TaxID=2799580 RepID=UPI001940CA96|nr:S-layer protein [Secundilactobacillus yichangensis]
MQSSLKKSLYLGLAAVSFVAVAGTTSANASAKSYAKAGSYSTLTTPAASRNVNLTGTNAVYTKPGTVKGAKLVATTTTAAKLNKSTNGSANFRAYGVKTTDRGSVYYKVVSFDGQYRGYVYGGKSTSAFAGGLVSYATTKDATAPKSTDVYNLNQGTTSTTANTLFFKEPAWTNYKVGRAKVDGKVLASTDAYKSAKFTFNKAVTTSREGDLWYQIASVNGSTSNGLVGAWVKASAVSNFANPANDNNSIYVKYVDSNANAVGTATFTTTTNTTRKGDTVNPTGDLDAKGETLAKFVDSSVPAGYVVTGNNNANNLLTNTAKYGSTIVINVQKGAASKVALRAGYLDAGATAQGDYALGQSIAASEVSLPNGDQTTLADLLKGTDGQIGSEKLGKINTALQTAFGTTGLKGTKTYTDNKGVQYYYVFKYGKGASDSFALDNRLANYGQNLTASVGVYKVTGNAATPTTNSSSVFN